MNDTMKALEKKHRQKKIVIRISIGVLIVAVGLLVYVLVRSNDKLDTPEKVFEFIITQPVPEPTQEELDAFTAVLEEVSSKQDTRTQEEVQAFEMLLQETIKAE